MGLLEGGQQALLRVVGQAEGLWGWWRVGVLCTCWRCDHTAKKSSEKLKNPP